MTEGLAEPDPEQDLDVPNDPVPEPAGPEPDEDDATQEPTDA